MNTWQRRIYIFIIVFFIIIAAVSATYLFVKHFSANSGAKPQKPLQGAGLPLAAPQAEALSSKKNLPIKINIPEGAGHVVEGFTAKGKESKIVIHIQDIHTNYEAQKNLSRIIEGLAKENNVRLIMVEGGWGDVSLSYLRSHADKERRLEVAEEYLREGKISGEEYLDIVSDYDIDLEGLEEEALYKENLNAFFEIEKFRQGATGELNGIKEAVDKIKEKVYPAQLIELEKAKQDYDNEKISLAEYYGYINTLAKKAGLSLGAYANFEDFIRATESEKHIDFPSVEKERSVLIERLSKNLSKQAITTLVTKSLEFRLNKLTPAEYHEYLIKEAEGAGEDLNRYPNFKKYVAYIKSHEEIDTTKLFEEADALLQKIKLGIISDAKQRRLDGISTAIKIIDNFLNLRLIPSDYKYYLQHKNDFLTSGWVDFLKDLADKNKIKITALKPAPAVDDNMAALARFYEIANERDEAFIKNIIKLMNEKGQNIAVVITGGFHTPPLKQKLAECGISYVVAAPHTTQQTDQDRYRYILKYKAGKAE